MEKGNYKKFALTMILSFVVMYGVMFLNVDRLEHIYISMTRFYMALLMVAPMALIMLVTMKHMYMDKRNNTIIAAGAVLIFILSLTGLRKQLFISDKEYMKAMIPHHSSAILTSKNASIKDAQVKKLSEGIILSQEREIQEMKTVLERMK